MKHILLICCFAWLVIAPAIAQKVLSPDQFQATAKTGVQLLDVRTAAEYQGGHLDNALQADWTAKEEFQKRTAFLDKDKPLLVYCLAGGRSHAAANWLSTQGFTNVQELDGGIYAWKSAGKPLEAAAKVPQISAAESGKLVAAQHLVLVDFGATWCPPCKKMEPVLASLQANQPGKFKLAKVDGGSQTDIMQTQHVTGLPTFILYRDGKEIWRKEGFTPEAELAAAINK